MINYGMFSGNPGFSSMSTANAGQTSRVRKGMFRTVSQLYKVIESQFNTKWHEFTPRDTTSTTWYEFRPRRAYVK